MPTMSPRALGVMLSGAALAGWLAGSTLSPPVAVTQVAPSRPAAAPVAPAALPRVTWPSAAPRVAPPAPSRNPFLFRTPGRAVDGDRSESLPAAPAADSTEAEDLAPVPPLPASPPWRLSGIASSDNGDLVAVMSGAGDVFLRRAGDQLPGGDTVEDVGPAHVVLRTASGLLTLRLP